MTELVVRDVTVRSVVVPLRRPLATKVGDFSQWPLLLIDVTTEQGITGRGYLAPYLSRAATALRHHHRPHDHVPYYQFSHVSLLQPGLAREPGCRRLS